MQPHETENPPADGAAGGSGVSAGLPFGAPTTLPESTSPGKAKPEPSAILCTARELASRLFERRWA